jgi:Cdc6-like AAA superfamily ATPase
MLHGAISDFFSPSPQVLQEVEVLNEKESSAGSGHALKRGPNSKLAVASAQLQSALGKSRAQTSKPSESGMVLVVLDEMDRLISRDQTVLYEMFKLASAPGSRCLLVGEAVQKPFF